MSTTIIPNAIEKFLADKKNNDLKKTLTAYPMQYVIDGKLKRGFVQDVLIGTVAVPPPVLFVRKDNPPILETQYHLEMIVLNEELTGFDRIQKTCIAPDDCVINWDTLHCVTSNVFNSKS